MAVDTRVFILTTSNFLSWFWMWRDTIRASGIPNSAISFIAATDVVFWLTSLECPVVFRTPPFVSTTIIAIETETVLAMSFVRSKLADAFVSATIVRIDTLKRFFIAQICITRPLVGATRCVEDAGYVVVVFDLALLFVGTAG